jgi:hypothetical protein
LGISACPVFTLALPARFLTYSPLLSDRQKIHAVLSNIKKDDNPVLFRFKLKKDAGL